MTSATLDRAPGTAEASAVVSGYGSTFRRVLDAEWTKIRTVSSTVWTLAALVVTSIGLTALLTFSAAEDLSRPHADEPVGAFLTLGLTFGQVAALVLGVLVASAEYSSGLIRTTLAATPRRWSVLGAKALILATILFTLGVITSFGSYLAGNYFLDREGIGMALDDPGVLRAIVGGGLYLGVLGIFGLGLGLLMRHTAAAVTVGIALVFVVGGLVGLIPGGIGEWLNKLMPGNAGSVVANVESFDPNLLHPWAGFAVFCAETAVLLAVAGVFFNRRDA